MLTEKEPQNVTVAKQFKAKKKRPSEFHRILNDNQLIFSGRGKLYVKTDTSSRFKKLN